MSLSTLYASPSRFNSFLIVLGIVFSGVLSLNLSSKVVASEWGDASFPIENFQGYKAPFGYEKLPNGSDKFHSGLDIAAPEGSFVRNWWKGKVVKVSLDPECGTSITIESGNWQHIYCNLKGKIESDGGGEHLNDLGSGIQISEGQIVEAGTRIGRIAKGEGASSPHLHWSLKHTKQWIDPALVIRAMYAEQFKKQQYARIAVDYNSPITPIYKAYENAFKNSHLIELYTDILSNKLALSRNITVTLKQCGQINAFYKLNRDEVVICYEIMELFINSIISTSKGKVNKATAIKIAVNMTIFTLHHELAHALIDQFSLPLAKSQEDAADELASVLIFSSNDKKLAQSVVDSASIQFLVFSTIWRSHTPIKTKHSPDRQRAYDIGCLAYGASPNTASLGLRKYIKESNTQKCTASYNQAKTYWSDILRPFLRRESIKSSKLPLRQLIPPHLQ